MAIVFLFLGCFILYGKSTYFPEYLNKIGELIKTKKSVANLIGYLFLLLSYALFLYQFDWATGFVIFLITLSFVYSLLLITLPVHKNYLYFIVAVSITLIMIENIL